MKRKRLRAVFAVFCASALLVVSAACTDGQTPDDDATLNDDTEMNGDETDGNGDENETPAEPVVETPEYAIAFGETKYQLATVSPADELTASATVSADGEILADAELTYYSLDTQIVTVGENDGVLKAVSAGETQITVSYTTEGETYTAEAAVSVLAEADKDAVNGFDEEAVNLFGRTYLTARKLTLDNVCTGIEISFVGSSLTAKISGSSKGKIRVFIDGESEGTETVTSATEDTYTLCEGLSEGLHTARILKASSPQYGKIYFSASNAFGTDGSFLAAEEKSDFKIEIIGDSITAGCGSVGSSTETTQTVENSDATKAFSYLTAQSLGADFSIMALEGVCVKDGSCCAYDTYLQYSPTTTTKYDPSSFDADVVVLALGENDMWHATSSSFTYTTEEFRTDYADMLARIREYHPNAQIVCVYGMMPASATAQAAEIIQAAIADTGDENITYLKLLTSEAGANYHPNARAHASNAALLTKHIQGLFA